ncbi:MAG: TadA family conjugal transfer-associated ATPase [Candidatus Nanopelagicales bacterium]|jgi:pilus assembly protein CpaF|nr:TadA family conjugal transfer-associated ATPase [Candidatus Nanopelagicales bacterium]
MPGTPRPGSASGTPAGDPTEHGRLPDRVDQDLVELVRSRLVAEALPADPLTIAGIVRESGAVLDRARLGRVARLLQDELHGLGPLDPLLEDRRITDILVNGPDEVWVDRGGGLQRVGVRFRDEVAVRHLAVRLAARAGRRLDDAAPFVDARLPGGHRLHALIPPLAVRGTTISLRVPARRRFSLADLVAAGSVDPVGARWLAAVVRARAAFLVSGGTGSGKTSVLGALLGLVPHDERIVVVEDTCELAPAHPHVVSLESRPANVEGSGAIGLQALVRQALRMRPDRLVVGEVRGAEVVDLLASLNTGHEGGCGTIHANAAGALPERVVALAMAAGLPREGAVAQLAAGLEVVIHVARRADGRRIVAEVGVVDLRPDGHAMVTPALVAASGELRPGPAHAALVDRLGGPP